MHFYKPFALKMMVGERSSCILQHKGSTEVYHKQHGLFQRRRRVTLYTRHVCDLIAHVSQAVLASVTLFVAWGTTADPDHLPDHVHGIFSGYGSWWTRMRRPRRPSLPRSCPVDDPVATR
jgi:hypothetical protein